MAKSLRRGSLNAFTLALTVYCCVSGGPYGLEEAIGTAGPGLSLLLLLLVPIFWALPDALMTAELASAIPEEGGYVIWVRRAMGPFFGFINAWWTWMYALIDATIYPVLFGTYLLRLLGPVVSKGQEGLFHWAVATVVIVVYTIVNIRGTKLVGKTSSVFAIVIIAPFLLLGLIGLFRLIGHPQPIVTRFVPEGSTVQGALADGLGIVMWNYLGWDALSTVAEEVERPAYAYPRALLFGLPLVTLVYFLPVLGSLAFVPNPAQWKDGAWIEIASTVAGPWLGVVINAVGLVSASALFSASLLGSSRIPTVIAEMGFLPKWLMALHPRFGTPYRALVVCGGIYVLLALMTFRALVELNVILYGAALLLEIGSLLILRWKEPELPRPFKIRGGWPMMAMVFLSPAAVILTMAYTSVREDGWSAQYLDLGLLASGPILYVVVEGFRALRTPLPSGGEGQG